MPTPSTDLLQSRRLCLTTLLVVLGVSFAQRAEYVTEGVIGRHVWRQSQTMWNVRNFVRDDFNILNPKGPALNGGSDRTNRLEFPIYQWAIAAVQKVTGEHIAVARVFSFLLTAAAVFALFFLVWLLTSNWLAALLAAVLLNYAPTLYFHGFNPMPDNLALAAAMWYVYLIVLHRKTGALKHLIWASLMLSLATAAKLPFLMVSIVSISYFLLDGWKLLFGKRSGDSSSFPKLIRYAIIQLLIVAPALAWYAWVIGGWVGNPVLEGGLAGIDWAEYQRLLYFHATEMFQDTLTHPAVWAPAIIGLGVATYRFKTYYWLFPLIGLTFVYLFLELVPININHDYYLFPFLIWIYIVAGLGIDALCKIPYLKYALPLIIVWSALYTDARTSRWWSLDASFFDQNVLVYAEELRDAVPPGEEVIILNDDSRYIFSYKVDKLAHIFTGDDLPVEWIGDMVVNRGVSYMYSNSATYNAKPDFQPYIDEVILERGTVSVFRLRVPE